MIYRRLKSLSVVAMDTRLRGYDGGGGYDGGCGYDGGVACRRARTGLCPADVFVGMNSDLQKT